MNAPTELAAPPTAPGRHIPFPLVQPTNPLRLAIKRALGYALLALRPAVARAMDAGEGPAEVGRIDSMMMAALMHRAERRGELEEFIHRQQRRFWSSAEIADFHAAHERYFEDMFLGENLVSLLELEKALAGGGFSSLCEIGCGHGRVVYFLSKRLAGLARFTGIDLSAEQVRRNRERYPDAAIDWVSGDAIAWIKANGAPGCVFLTHNGVFEYFRRDDLRTLFRDIATRMKPAIFSISEPLGLDHDLEVEMGSPPYGYERSFSHNYVFLLKEAGFEILHRSEYVSGNHRLLRLVARA
jgi:SAM-dependent methyltransferase